MLATIPLHDGLTPLFEGFRLNVVMLQTNTPEDMLSDWIAQQVCLDYWLEEVDLTPAGLEGKRGVGECIVAERVEGLLRLKTGSGARIDFLSPRGFVVEFYKNSIGEQVQVRTPDDKAWIIFKPHTGNNVLD